jgi:hypothetical protein
MLAVHWNCEILFSGMQAKKYGNPGFSHYQLINDWISLQQHNIHSVFRWLIHSVIQLYTNQLDKIIFLFHCRNGQLAAHWLHVICQSFILGLRKCLNISNISIPNQNEELHFSDLVNFTNQLDKIIFLFHCRNGQLPAHWLHVICQSLILGLRKCFNISIPDQNEELLFSDLVNFTNQLDKIIFLFHCRNGQLAAHWLHVICQSFILGPRKCLNISIPNQNEELLFSDLVNFIPMLNLINTI